MVYVRDVIVHDIYENVTVSRNSGKLRACADSVYQAVFRGLGTRLEAKVKSEPISAVQPKADARVDQLQRALEDMTKRFEALESQLKDQQRRTPSYPPRRFRRPGGPRGRGQNFRRECPLNSNKPARAVGDSWRRMY